MRACMARMCRKSNSAPRPSAVTILVLFGMIVSMTVPTVSGAAAMPSTFVTGRAGFSFRFRDLECPYRVMAISVLPGRDLGIEAVDADPAAQFRLTSSSGTIQATGQRKWLWRVPIVSGVCSAHLVRESPPDTITIYGMVLVPFSQVRDGYLNGYRIGAYPTVLRKNLPI